MGILGERERERERRTGKGERVVGVTSYLELAPSSRNHHIMSPSLIIPQSSCDFMIAESNVWFEGQQFSECFQMFRFG